MNYFDYINELKPDDDLKNRSKLNVKNEIYKRNIKRNNIKKAYISMAACLIMLVASIFTARALTRNSGYIDNPTEISKKEAMPSEKILVSIASDGLQSGPQNVLFGDKLYVQYWKEDIIKEAETDNDKIKINESDIGELVYTIDEDNLVDSTSFKFLNKLNTETAQQNELYNAKVYKLNKCKNDTVFLVKEDKTDEYYFLYLIGVNSKNTVSEIINMYTMNGKNPIKYIDVKQQDSESKHIEKHINKTTIKEDSKINYIVNTLERCDTTYNVYDIIDKDLVKDEFNGEEYLLDLVFDDETRLKIYLYKEYFRFFVSQKDEYDYYLFKGSEYNSLIELFDKNN